MFQHGRLKIKNTKRENPRLPASQRDKCIIVSNECLDRGVYKANTRLYRYTILFAVHTMIHVPFQTAFWHHRTCPRNQPQDTRTQKPPAAGTDPRDRARPLLTCTAGSFPRGWIIFTAVDDFFFGLSYGQKPWSGSLTVRPIIKHRSYLNSNSRSETNYSCSLGSKEERPPSNWVACSPALRSNELVY